jgi:hypothetical protein
MQKGSNSVMDKTLGQILVERDIITQTKLDLALKRQDQEKGKYLGEILFEMGVPQDEIDKALNLFDKRKLLGQILIDQKIITPPQLEEALKKQEQLPNRAGRKSLGMLLVEMGYTSYDDFLNALSKHFNMPIISLRRFIPSPSLQKVVGEKYARKHMIVVLEDSAHATKIAMAEPTLSIMEELRKALRPREKIEFYLASPYELESCLKREYDPFSMTRYK